MGTETVSLSQTEASQEFRLATREQRSLLAAPEKRCLLWFAQRMPRWVNSDHLTLLGLAAMLAAGLSYWWARSNRYALFLVIFWLAVNWFGDSLDGTLARVRNQQRPRYGFYVDHIVDAFGALFLVGGLVLSGYLSAWVAVALLLAYFLLCIEVYLATYTLATFRLTHLGLGPTELRILIALGNLALFFQPTVPLFGARYLLFDVGGVVATAGLFVMFLAAAVRNTLALYRAERLP